MRKSEYYGVNVPELGDRADITVVSQAIIDSENNQSGKVENMKATVSGTIISLTSETRQDALLKYYNGLAVQFISPVNASAGSSYKIKIGNLTEQPYNNKVDIKVGDIVQAIYGSTGFISANAPIPRSSSVVSTSETTVATSKAVKQAYDKGVEGLDKANTKLDAGSVSTDYNSGEKIEDKIKDINNNLWRIKSKGFGSTSVDTDLNYIKERGYYTSSTASYRFINKPKDLESGSIELFVTGASEGIYITQFIKDRTKSNRIWMRTFDNEWSEWSEFAKVEDLWQIKTKIIGNTSTYSDLNDIKKPGYYISTAAGNRWNNTPYGINGAFYLKVENLNSTNYVQQTLTYYIDGKVYIRRYKKDDITYPWNSWKPLLTPYAGEFAKSLGNVDGYIQKEGTKLKDSIYYDQVTGQPYICKVQNTDITVTSNFKLLSLSTVNKSKKTIDCSSYKSGQVINFGEDIRTYDFISILGYEPDNTTNVVNREPYNFPKLISISELIADIWYPVHYGSMVLALKFNSSFTSATLYIEGSSEQLKSIKLI